MSEPHGQAHPLAAYLLQLTGLAGFTIDTDDLDPTFAHYPDQVAGWVRAAGRHAAATYLQRLLDGPIAFLRNAVGHGPGDPDGIDVELLTDLTVRRDALDGEVHQALDDLAVACRALTGTGLMWPVDATDPPPGGAGGSPSPGPAN